MKKTELNTNIMQNENAVKNVHSQEITAIINSNDSPKAMMNRLDDYHGSDIAEVISTLTVLSRKKFYRVCSLEMLAEIFEYLDEKQAGEYLSEMDIHKAAELISELDTDTAVNILTEIDKDRRSLVLDAVAPDVRSEIKLIASFDDEEIGSRMTTNCIIISEKMSVKQAMNALVSQARKNDNISTLFVVDENNVFSGAIDLKDLITADSQVALESITATSFPYVYANEQTSDCIEKLKDYSEYMIPVLDDSNKLLGVITAQNIIEASEDEMGEDYAKLGGLSAEEDLNEPVLQSVKKRLPWLLILLGLGMVVSTVVGAFEKVVAQLTLIVAFQSLILDMAGNVGTQSLAVTIRVLTDGSLTAKQKLHLVSKEMRVGLLNGTLIGVLSFLAVGLYIFLFKGKTLLYAFAMSGCIGISLVLAIIVSSAVGTLTPLSFKKIKIDPAVASGPMITTLNDLVAVVAYYGTSWIFLLNVLKLS
ncbi:magnesium transporter [Ruminococcus sp.]|uniref:magnesium transporter n=1 Tax=Ruminococcus sp. TaxID=41978 RepID=UPI003FD7DE4E